MTAQWRDRPHSFKAALEVAREILGTNSEIVTKGSIEAEAEQLVMAAHNSTQPRAINRTELYLRLNDRLPESAADRLLTWAGSRATGRPLQHVTGRQFFLEHEYEVGPEVLIPRPETEILVAHALEELKALAQPPRLGIEIGLGSGAISIELLAALPTLKMWASELTDEARQRARSNAQRILKVEGDAGAVDARLKIVPVARPDHVFEAFEGMGSQADFLISNPPYLTSQDEIEPEVLRHEPHSALFAPPGDPLHFYRAVANSAASRLRPGARIYLEIAHERALSTKRLFEETGWKKIMILSDLAGRDRVLIATCPGTR